MGKAPARIIGWRERVDLPELNLSAIKTKVDTGARSSSLHAEDIEIAGRARPRVHFRFQDERGRDHHLDWALHDQRWVKSSNGAREHRPVVRLEMLLGGLLWHADVTLTSRDTMGFPMLLGREALHGRFLVDPARAFVWGGKARVARAKARR